jgi:hypothetical protein
MATDTGQVQTNRPVLGKTLIELLAPMLDIETPDHVRQMVITVPFDGLVSVDVEFLATTRFLELNWEAIVKAHKPNDTGE